MSALSIPQNLSTINRSFRDDGLQIAWDSTSLGSFKSCPRKYYYEIVLSYRSKLEAAPLKFGIIYHAALEAFDHCKVKGDHIGGVRAAIKHVLTECWDAETQTYWEAALDNTRSTWTLLRSVIWYCDQYEEDNLSVIQLATGKAAVELSFSFDSGYELDGEPIHLCGHLDRLVTLGEQTYISDRKTTKTTLGDRYYQQFHVDNQMSLYSMAGKIVYDTPVAGVIIDACQVGVTFSRFGRAITRRSRPILEEWHKDLGFWLNRAKESVQAEYWPMNDKACFLCDFKEVCASPPGLRKQKLDTNFHKMIWDPLNRR